MTQVEAAAAQESGEAELEDEESVETSFLVTPEEPVELKEELQPKALLAPSQWAELLTADGSLAAWLWAQWGETLREAGLDPATFLGIVTGYKRELWLWLMGERLWVQAAQGLIGRVERRLPEG